MPTLPWTRQETLAALALYCKLPFGRLHARNPEIVALAQRLRRTPAALAMKCCNLASLDDSHARRSVAGLSKVSRLDRTVWQEFLADPESVCFEAASALDQLVPQPEGVAEVPVVEGRERESLIRVRVNQCFFRDMILASYTATCAVCDLGIPRLAVASHIVPWAADATNRMNPRNGICLCGTHDLAFEHGYLLVRPNSTIRVSDQCQDFRSSEAVDGWLFRYDGRPLRTPERWPPDPELLSRRYAAMTGGCAV